MKKPAEKAGLYRKQARGNRVTVTKDLQRLEHSSVKLTLTVGKDDVLSQYDQIIADYSKTIQIPGFRKGKAPRDVLIRKFGDALKGEALGHIIEKAITETLGDESLAKADRPLPYASPQLEGEPALELGSDLVFSVTYDVLPQVTVGPWQGLEVEAPDAAVTDEDLDRELEVLRDRNAIVLDKDDDAPAAAGDVVTVNYQELSDSGEPLAGTEREDYVFTLGTGYNIYHFDDELAGMKKGETRDIEKTYPQDFEDSALAGTSKKIRVSLTALKEKQLPDLDDDFAQDVDEKFNTMEDLKASIRERLTSNLDRRLRELTISRILEKIMETTPVEVPESMIRVELESRWRNMARQFNMDGDKLAQLMGSSGDGSDPISAEWRPQAEKALRSRLIVETLIQNEALEASDEEVEKELEKVADESGTPLEEVKKYYAPGQMLDFLKEDIKERKLFDRLLAENTIIRGKMEKYLDLIPQNG
jgi:trigger factor